mgnify:CR=1 FL=1
MNSFLKEPLVRFLAYTIALLAISAVSIHFTYFNGTEVGEIQGKVRSLYQQPVGGMGAGIKNISKAKVITTNGEKINVICEASCTLDLEVKVKAYKPLFRKKVIYIYHGP